MSRRDVAFFPNNTVITDLDAVEGIIRRGEFDTVINCVAVASHEACEKDPETAEAINSVFPGVWASAANEIGARFVHISTDAVFDGTSSGLYVENDETRPESVYGSTKVRGEQAVLGANPRALVLRVNFFWVVEESQVRNSRFFCQRVHQPITDYRFPGLCRLEPLHGSSG